MSPRTIFLVGAPTFSSLRWDERDLLSESLPPFEDCKGCRESFGMFSGSTPVKWRLLPALVVPETAQSKPSRMMTGGTQFLTTHDLATSTGKCTSGQEDSELSQFYDHSFTVHETSEVSVPGALSGESALDSGLWTVSTDTSIATSDERETPAARPHIQGSITDLKDIPNAVYLNSIVPQTMTVNLTVAIIDIRPPRRVITKHWKRELDLVEVVVGDETRTGFGVTFWLPLSNDKAATTSGCGDGAGEELRASLMPLRPRDIILLRNVGLSCFQDRVYGQSLRRGYTKIDLLHRQQVDATDTGGIYRIRDILNHAVKDDDLPLVKVRKVHEWIRRFVPDPAGGGSNRRSTTTLPPDSQDGML
ncbi:hypothetical protein BDW72DRAFT_170039 [Aspergillus terricola var. indicus]